MIFNKSFSLKNLSAAILKAGNNGEVGIFSLSTLVRKYRKWLLIRHAFGLDDSNVTEERIPLLVESVQNQKLVRTFK